MRAESIECQLAQNGEVLRSVVLAVAGAVLVEDDVEDPVQLVLDTPMGAGDCQHARWRPPSRQQEVSNNWWLLGIADPALQLDSALIPGKSCLRASPAAGTTTAWRRSSR